MPNRIGALGDEVQDRGHNVEPYNSIDEQTDSKRRAPGRLSAAREGTATLFGLPDPTNISERSRRPGKRSIIGVRTVSPREVTMVLDAATVVARSAQRAALPLITMSVNSSYSDMGPLCGLSTHSRRRPSRRRPANQEIRSGRRITQIAAECNGKT